MIPKSTLGSRVRGNDKNMNTKRQIRTRGSLSAYGGTTTVFEGMTTERTPYHPASFPLMTEA